MDLSSIYLPVILMGLLALGTWWLVRNAPKPQSVREAVVPGHEVDYYMSDFSVRNFDGTGVLTSTTVATADRALSNADGSEVQLFGNAKVVRSSNKPGVPQMEFRGEFLHAFVNEERVSSNKPVEIIRGKDRFTADSMVFNNITQVAELKGRVKGVLQPAR